jgi:hypothetical protein
LIDAASGVFRRQDALLLDIDELLRNIDHTIEGAEFLVKFELDLLNVGDRLLYLKRSLRLTKDGMLAFNSLTLRGYLPTKQLLPIRDDILRLTSDVRVYLAELRQELTFLIPIHKKLKIKLKINVIPVRSHTKRKVKLKTDDSDLIFAKLEKYFDFMDYLLLDLNNLETTLLEGSVVETA